LEYRAVDICEQIASTRAIDLAIRYALRVNKMALANKLETIADAKSDSKDLGEEVTENHQDTFTNIDNFSINNQKEDNVPLLSLKKPEVEIRPLAMSQTLKRTNPFLKAGSSSLSSKGKYYFFLDFKLLEIFSYCIVLQQVYPA
jgi:chromosome transmission fidelity protein 4